MDTPSSMAILGAQPVAVIFEISVNLRGVPSGLLASKVSSPS